jgi:amidase
MSDERPPSPRQPERRRPTEPSQRQPRSRYLQHSRPSGEPEPGTAQPTPRRPRRSGIDLDRLRNLDLDRLRNLDRRELIAAGAVAAAGIIGGAVWIGSRDGGEEPEAPAPPTQVAVASPTSPAVASPQPSVRVAGQQRDGEEALVETSIADLSGYLARGEVSSAALVAAATRRFDRYDTLYGAVIEMNPDAARIAEALDAELAQGKVRGPLHGMPVLLKDVVATGDNMLTTSGALALERNQVVEDATLVRRLREAGAVVLGKANMTEWSNVRSGGQISGYSGRGGQTRNPYDATMSTWGSSSGSAAAVALNYVPFAIGVETNGSIVCPAAACGIVGLKPTVGLVSRVGVMPVSYTWDSPGPMARSVADVAAVLNVIAGFDADDPAYGELGWASPASTVGGSPVPEFGQVDYTQALDPEALRGARLGICWQMWGIDPDADEVVHAVIQRLIDEVGVEVVENVVIPPLADDEMLAGSPDMVNAEFDHGTQAFFDRYTPAGPMKSLADVVAWNASHADEVLDQVGQEGLAEAEDALALDDPEYLDILSRVTTGARQEGMDAALDEHELDAFISPTVALPRPIDSGEFPGSATKASAISGYPGITIPAGYVRGLPVGLYLAGRAFSEEKLLGMAYAIEQLLQARIPAEV